MEEIEARAEQVLAGLPDYVWDGSAVPIPIEEIADTQYGLLVCEKSPDEMAAAPGAPPLEPGQSLSGLLLAGPGEIWVNAEEAREWPGRGRFTIGHELGHWILHRSSGQQALFCRHGNVDAPPDDGPPEIEREANAFAAAITMPAALMREHYAELKDGDECFERMRERFAASGAAMGRRMHAVI